MRRESEGYEMKVPSDRIKSLIEHQIRPPAVWQYLGEINQSIIALEIENEGLQEANQGLVAAANQSLPAVVHDIEHFKDCETWYGGTCDCSVRFIGMEEAHD